MSYPLGYHGLNCQPVAGFKAVLQNLLKVNLNVIFPSLVSVEL